MYTRLNNFRLYTHKSRLNTHTQNRTKWSPGHSAEFLVLGTLPGAWAHFSSYLTRQDLSTTQSLHHHGEQSQVPLQPWMD